ncbi:succinate--hydroxymethylglutarate CoA-transferase [Podospora australis]|uniref:Succinate--hydroxymethylglutarate CoA-transferase n=1 Tax=Podospora australis TaxID=1536484 RepID=A0AAN6WLH6_9PEZI|nr:succinate--hydroxymethylglutarate CoA-transferase [Podospora australis]
MATQARPIEDVYGPGTFTDHEFTQVPVEAARILRLLASQAPDFNTSEEHLSKVRFVGEDNLMVPGPIKAVPVAAALHAMAGLLADEILSLRTEGSLQESSQRRITINTTHTALWLGTVAAAYLNHMPVLDLFRQRTLDKYVPDWQRGNRFTPLKLRGTGIYPTKTPGKWYSLHGSLDAPPMLRSTLGIDPDSLPEIDTSAKAYTHISSVTEQFSPEELEFRNISKGFCGSICFTPEEWSASSMGKSLASRPLIDVSPAPTHSLPLRPVPFYPLSPDEKDKRPLKGFKILVLARIIAAPQTACLLASFGADVIRVHAPHLPDLNLCQVTLNAGQKTTSLDLRVPKDLARFHGWLNEADVFIQGFRPGRLGQFGLSQDEILSMAAKRGRGIVYLSESCYGPEGIYATRPGWQQVADCASGAAYVMGRTHGLPDGECVLPSLPISDMSCGVVGAVGVMMGLRNRATKGGSWVVNSALVRVNTFSLSKEVGLYDMKTVEECQRRFKWREMRGQHHVLDLLGTVWDGWMGNEVVQKYLKEDGGWFESWKESAFGQGMRLSILKPVVRFSVGQEEEKDEEGARPAWTLPSVPFGFYDADLVGFD